MYFCYCTGNTSKLVPRKKTTLRMKYLDLILDLKWLRWHLDKQLQQLAANLRPGDRMFKFKCNEHVWDIMRF